MVELCPDLSLRQQCELVGISRSGFYYEPVPESEENLALMRRLDELNLEHPFYGSRRLTAVLQREGRLVNRKRVVYSSELIRGVSSGVTRGATGQMRVLGRGAKGAVECYESVEQHRGWRCGLALGDGEALMRGSGGKIGRESYDHPCSARKRASSCKALWRAASSCWELDSAGGGAGLADWGA